MFGRPGTESRRGVPCQRQIHKQLTVQEPRRRLARVVCQGKNCIVHHAYRNGMDRLDLPGLSLNAVILFCRKTRSGTTAKCEIGLAYTLML